MLKYQPESKKKPALKKKMPQKGKAKSFSFPSCWGDDLQLSFLVIKDSECHSSSSSSLSLIIRQRWKNVASLRRTLQKRESFVLVASGAKKNYFTIFEKKFNLWE